MKVWNRKRTYEALSVGELYSGLTPSGMPLPDWVRGLVEEGLLVIDEKGVELVVEIVTKKAKWNAWLVKSPNQTVRLVSSRTFARMFRSIPPNTKSFFGN